MARKSKHSTGCGTDRRGFWRWLGRIALVGVGLGAYHWRIQLVPVFVALATLPAGWAAAITARTAGWWPWTVAAYVVAAVCAGAWLILGLSRTYDRIYGAVVCVTIAAWTLAVAGHPGASNLYGLWLLGWPLLGLGWWFGPAFRSARLLAWMRKRFNSAAELAGVAGSTLVGFRETTFGRVLVAKLPGDKTPSDLSRDRLESAFETREGGAKVVTDPTNKRRFELHITDVDPWAGDEITHPAVESLVLAHPELLADGLDDELREVA